MKKTKNTTEKTIEKIEKIETIEKTELSKFNNDKLNFETKLTNYQLPTSKIDILNIELFKTAYQKSLEKYQLIAQTDLNNLPTNTQKINLLKSQIFNVQKIDNNVLMFESLLSINNKTCYANCMLLYSTNFEYNKFIKYNSISKQYDLNIKNCTELLTSFANNCLEKSAKIKLNETKNIKNNLNRLKTILIKMLTKNKNVVLTSVRNADLKTMHFNLFDSFFNSIQNYVANNFEIKTKLITKNKTEQI